MTRTSRPLASLVAAILFLFTTSVWAILPPNTRYFDVNDDGPESGVLDGTVYLWDTVEPYWNAGSNGSGSNPGTTAAWVNGDTAVFSAGNDGTGQRYGVNIASGITAASATIEDGIFVINNGTLDTGS